MNTISPSQYNLDLTLLGGQAFNFDFDGEYYWGFTQEKIIKLKKENNNIFWQTYPQKDDLDFLKNYLRLDVNYSKILKKIQKDHYIKSAIKKFPNIRLLKQDFEQTLLSFLVTPNNNIKAIRKIIRLMCKRFGKRISIDGKDIFLFPKTEVLANAELSDLLECKLGFRAKFIKSCAKYLLKSNLSSSIHSFSTNKARNTLKEIKGVGDKIADCVLVFSLGFDNLTPLDVWAKRALINFYKIDPKMKYEEMSKWVSNYFGSYTSWAGQFLYEYIRSNN